MAAGRPVIAYAAGCVMETIIPNETGLFFRDQTWESLLDTVLHFSPTAWDPARIREHARQFSIDRFKTEMRRYVEDRYEESQRGLAQHPLAFFHEQPRTS